MTERKEGTFSGNWEVSVAVLFSFLFVKSLVFAFLIPPWMGNDEPNHFEYVLVLASEGTGKSNQEKIIKSLNKTGFWEKAEMKKPPPTARTFNETDLRRHSEDFPGTRPPLYYFFASLPLRLFTPDDMETALLLSRMVSVAFSMLTLWLVYLGAWNVFEGVYRKWSSVVAVLLAGLHPQFSYLGVVVNSDTLIMLLFSLLFYIFTLLIKRGGVTAEETLLILLVLFSALLTKKHGVILLPVIFAGLAAATTYKGRKLLYFSDVVKRWLFFIAVLAVGMLVLEYFATLNVIKIIDRIGLSLGRFFFTPADWATLSAGEWLKGFGIIFVTFWFTYGQMVHKMSFGFYFLYGFFTLAVCLGVSAGIYRFWKKSNGSSDEFRNVLFSLFFLLVVMASTIFTFFSPELIHRVSGRYLFYAIAPVSVLTVYGLRNIQSFIRFTDVEGAAVTIFFIMNLVSIFGYILPIYYS